MDDAEAIWRNGWRQGSVLLPDSLNADCTFEPQLSAAEEEAVFIVLSQDCDVVQREFDKEPYIELIRAVPLAGAADGNYLHGKNPRLIDIPIGERHYRCCCHDRTRILRAALASCAPSEIHTLDGVAIGLLREWVAKRYVRPAFPDKFNSRTKTGAQGKAIRRLLEKHGHLFRDLYLFCDPLDRELDQGETYRVALWPTMATADHENPLLKEQANKACIELEAAMSGCLGVEVTACELRNESQITLDDLRYFNAWDFDYLTHRDESAI